MTLSMEELKRDVILAVCTSCGQQARFTPAENRIVRRRVYDFATAHNRTRRVYRKPQRYTCQNCGETTFFPSLSTSLNPKRNVGSNDPSVSTANFVKE